MGQHKITCVSVRLSQLFSLKLCNNVESIKVSLLTYLLFNSYSQRCLEKNVCGGSVNKLVEKITVFVSGEVSFESVCNTKHKNISVLIFGIIISDISSKMYFKNMFTHPVISESTEIISIKNLGVAVVYLNLDAN